VIKKQTDP